MVLDRVLSLVAHAAADAREPPADGEGVMAAPARSPWIVSPPADLLLVVGMPVVCLALVPLARALSSQAVWAAVMSFGAVGHHLPGFLRTYGDRDLFRRYRARFVLAPPLLFAATLACAFRDLHTMALVSLVWSLWHGMMQHYGFLRIYDAKVGSVAPATARLDWLISLAWFAVCLVWSPGETASLLEALWRAGLGAPSPAALHAAQLTVGAATAAITVAYLVHLARSRRSGAPQSPLKLALLVSTSGLVYFARVVTTDQFLAAALFELLHDVQYLAIVWAFNRRRVAQGSDRGAVGRLLFRGGRARVLAYVALCLAYGAASYTTVELVAADTLKKVLVALFTASGILHFYYDGFIWKVREPDTRAGLGLDAPTRKRAVVAASDPVPVPVLRSVMHASYFVVPIALLAALELRQSMRGSRTGRDALTLGRAMVAAAPSSAQARYTLGAALLDGGEDPSAALPELRAALRLSPDYADALALVGDVLERQGGTQEAAASYERALALGAAGARVHNNFGNVLLELHRPAEAVAQLEQALRAAPGSAATEASLGVALDGAGRSADAVEHLQAALRIAPATAGAENDLGAVLVKLGRRDEALPHFEQALRLDPGYAPARDNLRRFGGRQPVL
jgi:Tfp pilus assembly protein PilF